MSDLVWVPGSKPDRPGIWAMRNLDGSVSIQEIRKPDCNWSAFTWCFLMDLPDIKDPPKYRTPTMADVGKMVEVSDGSFSFDSKPKELLAVMPPDTDLHRRFIVRIPNGSWTYYRHARILDDGQPVRKPREFYVTVDSDEEIEVYYTKEVASEPSVIGQRFEVIHVREVIDEPVKKANVWLTGVADA